MANNKKLTRSRDERIITGVAGGIAEYFGTDPSLIRIIFVLAVFLTEGLMILVYILMALIVPEEKKEKINEALLLSKDDEVQAEGSGFSGREQQEERVAEAEKRLKRSRDDRIIFGVAGGIGKYFDTDPVFVRLIFVIAGLFTAGVMIFVYILMAVIIPED